MSTDSSEDLKYTFTMVVERPEQSVIYISFIPIILHINKSIKIMSDETASVISIGNLKNVASETTDFNSITKNISIENIKDVLKGIKKIEESNSFSLFNTNHMNRIIHKMFNKEIGGKLSKAMETNTPLTDKLPRIEYIVKQYLMSQMEKSISLKLHIRKTEENKIHQVEKDLALEENEQKLKPDKSISDKKTDFTDNSEKKEVIDYDQNENDHTEDIENNETDNLDKDEFKNQKLTEPITETKKPENALLQFIQDLNKITMVHNFEFSVFSPSKTNAFKSINSILPGDYIYVYSENLNSKQYEELKNIRGVQEDKRKYGLKIPVKVIKKYYATEINKILLIFNINNKFMGATITNNYSRIDIPSNKIINKLESIIIKDFNSFILKKIDSKVPDTFIKAGEIQKKEEDSVQITDNEEALPVNNAKIIAILGIIFIILQFLLFLIFK